MAKDFCISSGLSRREHVFYVITNVAGMSICDNT